MASSALSHHLHRQTNVSYIMLSALGISAVLLGAGAAIASSNKPPRRLPIKAPKSQIPRSEAETAASLSILPGSRDIETPYGSIRVFEWGPEDGEKVLLMHGISTPCLSLANLAEELVARGYRVMIFDFFGRGYSDAPVDLPYDLRLYTTQILLVLSSSGLAWTGNDAFHLVGYSLGGGVAVSFARYYSHMIRSLVLVASSGLVRTGHVSWRSRVLYSTGTFPEGVQEFLVRRRITPSEEAVATEERMAGEVVDAWQTGKGAKKHANSDASGGGSYDNAILRPGLTVSAVMKWQLRCHEGFIKAFMSSIRYAPIYERTEDWRAVGELLDARRRRVDGVDLPGLRGGRVLMVLGSEDPVIVKEELIHDATAVWGEDGFEVVMLECGHEIVMTKGREIADLVSGFWKAH